MVRKLTLCIHLLSSGSVFTKHMPTHPVSPTTCKKRLLAGGKKYNFKCKFDTFFTIAQHRAIHQSKAYVWRIQISYCKFISMTRWTEFRSNQRNRSTFWQTQFLIKKVFAYANKMITMRTSLFWAFDWCVIC